MDFSEIDEELDYDYDSVIEFCKNPATSSACTNIVTDLNNLVTKLDKCQQIFHSKNKGKEDVMVKIYQGFSDIIGFNYTYNIGEQTLDHIEGRGGAAINVQAAKLFQTCYEEAVLDQDLMNGPFANMKFGKLVMDSKGEMSFEFNKGGDSTADEISFELSKGEDPTAEVKSQTALNPISTSHSTYSNTNTSGSIPIAKTNSTYSNTNTSGSIPVAKTYSTASNTTQSEGPSTGTVYKNQINFEHVYTNNYAAENKTNNVKVSKNAQQWWGDSGNMTYERQENGSYLVKDGDGTPLGYIDEDGIKF